MKKTLSVLALAALVAGCSSDDNAATAKSPWSTDGNTGSSGNPLARAVTTTSQPDQLAGPVERSTYSWDKPAEATPATAPATGVPEEGKIRITGIRGELGLFSFIRAEKPEPQQILIVSKDNKGARVRVVEVEGDDVIAELLPNQLDTPALLIGEEVSAVIEQAPAQ